MHHHKFWIEGYCEEKLEWYKTFNWWPDIEWSDTDNGIKYVTIRFTNNF